MSYRFIKNAHKDIEFITNLDGDLPEVYIDKQQMKRAFMNIIDNGVYSVLLKRQGRKESAGYSGRITISTKKDADKNIVRIVFADNGTGMEGEVMQNMYEPYFSTKQGGTGLGLAITKNIMVENNAQIRAENNEDGGASFIIELKPGEGRVKIK
jgi:Signal transduction histidine kinase